MSETPLEAIERLKSWKAKERNDKSCEDAKEKFDKMCGKNGYNYSNTLLSGGWIYVPKKGVYSLMRSDFGQLCIEYSSGSSSWYVHEYDVIENHSEPKYESLLNFGYIDELLSFLEKRLKA